MALKVYLQLNWKYLYIKQVLKSGDEVDAILGREWYRWRSGTIKKIKRALNKRIRKEGKNYE